MQTIQGGQFDPARAVAQFQYYLTVYEKNVAALQRLKTAYEAMIKAPGTVTSELHFKIGVLNSGDSDGVVFDSGTVDFNGTVLPLTSDDYKVIKAHSFDSIDFQMFYGEVNPEKTKISAIVRNQNVEIPFRVSIKAGKKTLGFDGVLPKADESPGS